MYFRKVFMGLSALYALGAIACSPYPMYNANRMPPREARAERAEEEANPADHEPAVDPQRNRHDRGRVSSATTIDSRLLQRIVDTYLKTPYRRGGDNLRGIDCSNLVSCIYRDYDGTELPEDTRGLYRLPNAISEGELQVGDLVFFNFSERRSPSHVGVFLGNRRFVHASETDGVIISSLDESTYHDAYSGARRVASELHSGE